MERQRTHRNPTRQDVRKGRGFLGAALVLLLLAAACGEAVESSYDDPFAITARMDTSGTGCADIDGPYIEEESSKNYVVCEVPDAGGRRNPATFFVEVYETEQARRDATISLLAFGCFVAPDDDRTVVISAQNWMVGSSDMWLEAMEDLASELGGTAERITCDDPPE